MDPLLKWEQQIRLYSIPQKFRVEKPDGSEVYFELFQNSATICFYDKVFIQNFETYQRFILRILSLVRFNFSSRNFVREADVRVIL